MNDEALETYLNIVKTHSLTKTAGEHVYLTVSSEQPAHQPGKGIECETY